MEQSEKTLDMIVGLCKNRGYVFPGSDDLRRPCKQLGLRPPGR